MTDVVHPCAECGAPTAKPKHCSTPCRIAWTRRRRERGAELYDFAMGGDWMTVQKLLKAYQDADHVLRDGRASYQRPEVARVNLPIAYGPQGDRR